MEFERTIQGMRDAIDARLAELAPSEEGGPSSLHAAMRYALLGRGKRVRGIVTLLAAESFGAAAEVALAPACALEMVHATSLVLDDLPCMDDASLRRGRPTCHRVFGEDIATLAAFGLLVRAYSVLAEAPAIDPDVKLELVQLLARVIGEEGMIAGQVRDLRGAQGVASSEKAVELVARQKTGSLFVACAETGARLARVSSERLEFVRAFAWNLGLYFQTLDDVLDARGAVEVEGKELGRDARKTNLVNALGAEPAQQRAEDYLASAHAALGAIGEIADPLRKLGDYLLETGRLRTGRR